MIKYQNIIFLQSNDATEALDILNEKGTDAAIDYLSQWDNGDEGQEVYNESQHGSSDRTTENEHYLLSYNEGLGYIGLMRKLKSRNK